MIQTPAQQSWAAYRKTVRDRLAAQPQYTGIPASPVRPSRPRPAAQVHEPHPATQLAGQCRQPGPACQSEGNGTADLLEMAIGLRAMVKGTMPEAKPAAPMVVSEVLPQSGPREHVARRAAQIKGSRFVSLARCEEQAWAEIQWAATNNRVWAESRALKGMWDAVDSIEHTAQSVQNSTGEAVSPDDLGLSGTTEGTVLDQLAAEEEATWKVETVMSALSDREWSILQMRADGASREEMADRLGISPKAVKKALESGRAKAKAALA